MPSSVQKEGASIRVAIVGLGRVGLDFSFDSKRVQPASHVGCYNSLPDVDAIAVCDVDHEKLTKAMQIIDKPKEAYDNLDKMMVEFQPEIISIATPTPIHQNIICKITEHSCVKSILLEKPIAQSLEEADKIIEACKQNDIKLAVNYSRRWSAIYRMAKQAVSQFGLITGIGLHPGPLLRTGTHLIDVLNWMADLDQYYAADYDEIRVSAFGNKSLAPYLGMESNDYNLNGNIEYPESQAVIVGEKTNYLLFEVDLLCELGRIQIINNGEILQTSKAEGSSRYKDINELSIRNALHEPRENMLLNAIKEVVSIADCKTYYKISCTGEGAKLAMHIALALHYSSSQNNKMIRLKDVPYNYTVRSY